MNKYTQKRQSGSALITVLIIVMIVVAAGGTMIGMASQQAYSARLVRDEIKAQSLAEAGANEAYAILKADFSAREDSGAFPEKEYGGGSYDAEVSVVGDDMATITVVAQVGDATATVKLDVKDFSIAEGSSGGGGGTSPPGGAYEYAIFSGGNMTWTGSGTTDLGGGDMYCGGRYKMTGSVKQKCGWLRSVVRVWCTGSSEILANCRTPLYKGSSPGNVSGIVETGSVAPMSLPEMDLSPYYQYALSHGEVYNGNQHFTGSSDIEPNGGIMWVNGRFKWSGSGKLIGCFIATDDINITGSGEQIKVNDFPALISRDGDIDVAGSGKFHGLMYAMAGDFDKSGSGDVLGAILCAGKFKKSGSWYVMNYEPSVPPDDPGDSGGGSAGEESLVRITCWHM